MRTNVLLNVQINKVLTEQEQQVFLLINSNTSITKEEMASRLDKSTKTIQRTIASLLDKGIVERVGSNKTGYWRVKDSYDD